MRITSVLGFIIATGALATPLDNDEAFMTDIDSVDMTGDLLAVLECQKPVNTSACQEYCNCRCTDVGLDCPFNPIRCPESTYNICVANCGCSAEGTGKQAGM